MSDHPSDVINAFNAYRADARDDERAEDENYENIVALTDRVETPQDISDEESGHWISIYRDLSVAVHARTDGACRKIAREYADYAIWALADLRNRVGTRKVGEHLTAGLHWRGSLDLTDAGARNRLNDYLKRKNAEL